MSEPLTQLADLPSAVLDPAKAERLRKRCRAQLERQTPRVSDLRGAGSGGTRARVWQPLILMIAVGYMTEAIVLALRVYGLL